MKHLKILFTKLYNLQSKIYNFLIFKIIAGRKVATTKDKNNNDCEINGANVSFGIKIPTNKLFEKSGNGNNKKPLINPTTIDVYAVFSLMPLL